MSFKFRTSLCLPLLMSLGVTSCAQVSVPDARNVKIPSPISAEERREAVNERPDSVMYLPLGADVLVPERIAGDSMPTDKVGPFELRSETLAGALQLILADYDVSIAFETEEGLSRKVTVANLHGNLDTVVNRVCSLADLYCSFEDGTLVVKDVQTFAVTLPPLASATGGSEFISDVITGLGAILGGESRPVSDSTTRSIIYTATQRTSKLAENYFQRLRANTAMIVFETYIWEVSLDSGNSTGIDWDKIEAFGKFNASIDLNGSVGADFTNPVSIGLPTTQSIGASPTQLVEFLSQFGAVKTISQPQITVLSGSEAELRVADTENYVSEVTSTISGDNTTTSVSTDSVDSGFTLTIDSSWDKSTVYANININLTNVDQIEDFTFSDSGAGGTDTIIQLPQTTERELTTQIRVRPGDSVLIGGLVRETDNFNSRGPGFMEPIFPDSRTATTENLELVILLRPRVIVYTAEGDMRYQNFIDEKNAKIVSSKINEEWLKSQEREKIERPLVEPPKVETPKAEAPKVETVNEVVKVDPLPIIQSPEVETATITLPESEPDELEVIEFSPQEDLPEKEAVRPVLKESEPVVSRGAPLSLVSRASVSRAPTSAPQSLQFSDRLSAPATPLPAPESFDRIIQETVEEPTLYEVIDPEPYPVLQPPSSYVRAPEPERRQITIQSQELPSGNNEGVSEPVLNKNTTMPWVTPNMPPSGSIY